MAHDKVYGVCQNKCKVEVSPKSEKFVYIDTINLSMNFRVSFYRYKNMVIAKISGTLPASPSTLEYPESIPYPLYCASARNLNNSGYAKILSTDDKKITVYGSVGSQFECDLFFLVGDDPLSAVCEVSRNTINLNDKIKIRAIASNGYGPYKYSCLVRNMKTNEWFRLADNIDSDEFIWTAGTIDAREFFVEVKDERGDIVRSEGVSVEILEPLNGMLLLNGSNEPQELKLNNQITLTVNASGGTQPYKYQYVVNNTTGTEEYILCDWTNNNTYSQMISTTNDKIFYVRIMDGVGNVVTTNSIKATVKSS